MHSKTEGRGKANRQRHGPCPFLTRGGRGDWSQVTWGHAPLAGHPGHRPASAGVASARSSWRVPSSNAKRVCSGACTCRSACCPAQPPLWLYVLYVHALLSAKTRFFFFVCAFLCRCRVLIVSLAFLCILKGGLKRLHDLIWAWRMLHQKMQKFQRRLFYAPLSSEDNAIIENSKDSVTLLREWIPNQNCQSHLGLLAASQRPHNYHLRLAPFRVRELGHRAALRGIAATSYPPPSLSFLWYFSPFMPRPVPPFNNNNKTAAAGTGRERPEAPHSLPG
jgi:hypothetical protein